MNRRAPPQSCWPPCNPSEKTTTTRCCHTPCTRCVWWFESTCEEYSRGNSQCLYLVCVRECAYIHSTSLVAPSVCSKSQSVWRMRQCSSLHLQTACKWKLWLCLLFKGSAIWKCSAVNWQPPTPHLCSAHMLIRSLMNTVRFQPCVRFKSILVQHFSCHCSLTTLTTRFICFSYCTRLLCSRLQLKQRGSCFARNSHNGKESRGRISWRVDSSCFGKSAENTRNFCCCEGRHRGSKYTFSRNVS